jgi:hypothetical protein
MMGMGYYGEGKGGMMGKGGDYEDDDNNYGKGKGGMMSGMMSGMMGSYYDDDGGDYGKGKVRIIRKNGSFLRLSRKANYLTFF